MSERSAFQRFLIELRRRHVPQTAAIYLVAAWAAIEFSDVVVPNLNGPQWIVKAVIVAAGVGFPVVLILAWMYDWGPEGVVRTGPGEELAGETGSPTGPTSTPWLAVIAVLVVGIGSAVGVAALLTGGDDGGGATDSVASEPERRGGGSPEGEARAPSPPPRPQLVPVDSVAREALRGLDLSGLEGLADLESWKALAELGALRGGDSAREELAELALRIAEESELSVFIREPSAWRLGHRVPVTLPVGDTLVVQGVAQDTAGVVAVTVDGDPAAEVDEPQPLLAFTARLVGEPVVGLREIPIVVRTVDGRELRTVYSLASPDREER
jgi:hypothetical protein